MKPKFVHLHNHSDFSLLDGAMKLDAMVDAAANAEMPAIALTDHGVLYGAMAFYEACKKRDIKPIIGVEGYITLRGRKDRKTRDENHITLLAADEQGYRNLVALVTKSFTEGFYYKPRIDYELLEEHQAGLICLSGCLGGLVQQPLVAGDYEGARTAAQTYKDIFGDRFYLEIMRHGIDLHQKIEADMLRLSQELCVPLVATNDCHYLRHEDHDAHDAVLCIGTGKTLSDPKRLRFDGDGFHLRTAEEMAEAFIDLPQALQTSVEIAERVNLEISNKGFHIPAFPIPAGKVDAKGSAIDATEYLRRLCNGGLRKRYGDDRAISDTALRERLTYELDVIAKMGFADYFLIVWDFIKWARDNDIPVGPGRGSVVGSLVSYCLRITDLDPLRFNLLFERFLNPDRISMPDIDTDFCVERRDAVIDYVREKYGAERVAQIVTHGSILARSAIRDCGRVLDLPIDLVSKVATLVPGGPKGLSVTEARAKVAQLGELERREPGVKTLLDLAQRVEGLTRQVGTHAAGVVIADAPLTEYLPLVRLPDGSLNTQYDMGWVEKLGLLKMDFLGLRNLTVMDECARWIRANDDPEFALEAIPDDDSKTFEIFARGDTTGVFQMESDGLRRVLRDMAPTCLDDLIAAVALYRPGPMEWIPLYIDGKHGRRQPTYIHPALEPILAPTYGIPVYQEQVMQMARAIAGFSMSEADELRKVVGKKIPEKMPVERKKFIEGATRNGVEAQIAEAIFKFIEPFAGYGFNKAHAVAYGWIAYQTAWLRANHSVPYFCALLNSVRDNAEKIVEYLAQCQTMGIPVLPPDVNESAVDFAVIDRKIRFGLSAIKGVGAGMINSIVQAREDGAFTNLDDLAQRTRDAGVSRKTLETLIKVGACDGFGPRGALLAALGPAAERAGLDREDRAVGQESFFAAFGGAEPTPLPESPEPPLGRRLRWEKRLLGYYVTGHPVDEATPLLRARKAASLHEARSAQDGERVRTGGLLSGLRPITTRNKQLMLSATLEDRSGSMRVILFPPAYARYGEGLVEGALVVLDGMVKLANLGKNPEEEPERELRVDRAEVLAVDEDDERHENAEAVRRTA